VQSWRRIGLSFFAGVGLYLSALDRLISGKKGKTMTKKAISHVIWDFPVKLFNVAAKKIRKRATDRKVKQARWLNG
jgi:hypothetical protein